MEQTEPRKYDCRLTAETLAEAISPFPADIPLGLYVSRTGRPFEAACEAQRSSDGMMRRVTTIGIDDRLPLGEWYVTLHPSLTKPPKETADCGFDDVAMERELCCQDICSFCRRSALDDYEGMALHKIEHARRKAGRMPPWWHDFTTTMGATGEADCSAYPIRERAYLAVGEPT